MSEQSYVKMPEKGPEAYLSPEERQFVQRILSFPEELPPKFKSWIGQEMEVNGRITTSQIEGFSSTWKEWTPTLTGSTGNPTLGTGSVAHGRYVRIGKTVCGTARVFVGTSGFVNGSGEVRISLPVQASVSYAGHVFVTGNGWIYDNSAATLYTCSADITAQSYLFLRVDASGTVGFTTPFTFANSDDISVCFTYEAA